jgi:hypothetical protein
VETAGHGLDFAPASGFALFVLFNEVISGVVSNGLLLVHLLAAVARTPLCERRMATHRLIYLSPS